MIKIIELQDTDKIWVDGKEGKYYFVRFTYKRKHYVMSVIEFDGVKEWRYIKRSNNRGYHFEYVEFDYEIYLEMERAVIIFLKGVE
jgi:hypothetical protein